MMLPGFYQGRYAPGRCRQPTDTFRLSFYEGADVMYIVDAILPKPSAAALGQRQAIAGRLCATRWRLCLFYARIPVQIGGGKFVAEQHRVFILHVIIPAIAGIASESVL